MPDKTTIRKFIRHPADVPIQVTLDWAGDDDHDDADQTITNVSLGGLAFISQEPLELLQRVRIAIPVLDEDNFLVGTVVWCDKADGAWEVGVEFEHGRDAYRLRMIEQICHIEHYRNEVARTEGRELSSQDAAREWIARFAGDFPAL